MLQRMSDQHKIGFLENNSAPEQKKAEQKESSKTLKQVVEEQKSKKLTHKDNGLMTSKHISSARTGVVGDQGGPSKQVKMESSNTIFDSNKNARLSKDVDSKTNTQQAKERIATNRRVAEENRMSDLAENLKNTMQGKASSVTPASSFQGSNYKDSTNNFSIFDSQDFQRVPDKTAGEKVTEEASARKSQKDDSWKEGGKSKTTKEAIGDFFNKLFEKK